MLRALVWILVAVLLGGAVYELALAVGAGSATVKAGEDVAGSWWVELAALLAMLVGVVCSAGHAMRPRRRLGLAMLAPAAAAFLVTFFYTYDPYYGPSLERYSEREFISPAWVLLVALLAVGAGALVLVRPRAGPAATAGALLLALFTTFIVPLGH